jgi:hypothetical protein
MRYTVLDKELTVSFVAPGNILKALAAGCSSKPSPTNVIELLKAASNYDTGLQRYVLDGLSVFDEHYSSGNTDTVEMDASLEAVLLEILQVQNPAQTAPEDEPAISYDTLLEAQKTPARGRLSRHPVFRVVDEETKTESLEPVGAGLILFNLTARRIVQVQNSYGLLKRSDRGRYFENGKPTDRLYNYRLPADWSLVP